MKKISLVCMLFLVTFSACCTSSKKAPEKPPLVTRITTYLKDNALSIVLGAVLVVGFYVWAKDRTRRNNIDLTIEEDDIENDDVSLDQFDSELGGFSGVNLDRYE